MIPTSSFFLDLPKMEKIVCHIGVGSSTEKRSHVLRPMVLLTLLTGQKSIPCLSKKAVAGFHLRENSMRMCSRSNAYEWKTFLL
jgi:ribosomal protein L5